jgi:hypothetical protein
MNRVWNGVAVLAADTGVMLVIDTRRLCSGSNIREGIMMDCKKVGKEQTRCIKAKTGSPGSLGLRSRGVVSVDNHSAGGRNYWGSGLCAHFSHFSSLLIKTSTHHFSSHLRSFCAGSFVVGEAA